MIVGKTFHFLAGLYRSGNTVLSSILNQHPDIYSSPLSPVAEYMWRSYRANIEMDSALTSMHPERFTRMISSMLDSYYQDVKKPIVLDREKNWANPDNIQMIKDCLGINPKIIFTTRPIIEILASYIAINTDGILANMSSSGFEINENLTLNDNLCDFLMSEKHYLPRVLNALHSIDNLEYKGMIHIVKYQDLLDAPQETMNDIYDFLEIEQFKHNFTNIRKIEEYNEAAAGLPKDLHKIRRVLGKSDVKVEEYLTPYAIEKYKDVRYY